MLYARAASSGIKRGTDLVLFTFLFRMARMSLCAKTVNDEKTLSDIFKEILFQTDSGVSGGKQTDLWSASQGFKRPRF